MCKRGVFSLALACTLVVLISADSVTEKGVCCGDLGCYSPGGPFYAVPARPFNSIPDCSLVSRLFLRLNTRKNPLLTQILTPYEVSTITDSNFDPKKQTKILIHGFLDRYTRPPWKAAADNLLKDGDHNVIRVDWSQGNVPPYLQACANLRLVGAYVAKFLHIIVSQLHVDPKNIHIIGHSLGAHGSGYAGELMQSLHNVTIGRITGLDPAGPYFTNMPAIVRLDPSDAEFVDTIVTNGDIYDAFGSPQAMGHLNFYPNGGLNQPGCSSPLASTLLNSQGLINVAAPFRAAAEEAARAGHVGYDAPQFGSVEPVVGTSFDKMGNLFDQDAGAAAITIPPAPGTVPAPKLSRPDSFDIVGCSHNRAVEYFADSILNDSCTLTGYQCDTYDLFLDTTGTCGVCVNGTTCSRVGLYVNSGIAVKNRIKRFFYVTRASAPYCSNFKLQFTLQTANPAQPDNDAAVGSVYMTLHGSLGSSRNILLSKPEYIDLIPGKSYAFYPEIAKDLGQLTSVTMNWKTKSMLGIFARTDYIFLDGEIRVTDQNGKVNLFTPARAKVDSSKDLNARFVRQLQN